MTFTELKRGPKVKANVPKPTDDEVALKWRANPTAPFLDIAIGRHVAWSMGLRYMSERVDVLFGEGDDAGKLQIRRSENGSWLCQVRSGRYCVFLDSDVSIARFAMFPGVEIQGNGIEVRDGALTFPIPVHAMQPTSLAQGVDFNTSQVLKGAAQ